VKRMNSDNATIRARLEAGLAATYIDWHPDGSDSECVAYEFLRSQHNEDEDAASSTSTQEKQTEDTTSRTSSTKKNKPSKRRRKKSNKGKTNAYKDRVRLDSGAATRGLQRGWHCIEKKHNCSRIMKIYVMKRYELEIKH